MLQQTQTYRAQPKYELFINRFSSVVVLADATLKDVLTVWQGLGYNRRALYVKQAAEIIVNKFGGKIPKTIDQLTTLPGIGAATAGAILAYAFNEPVIFIETNIRAVFLHCFFKEKANVADKTIEPLIEETLDRNNPREWYYALNDYGAMLKSKKQFRNTASRHYTKQSKFEGSNRQIRGVIIRHLTKQSLAFPQLLEMLNIPDEQLASVLTQLHHDGLISKKNNCYHISS